MIFQILYNCAIKTWLSQCSPTRETFQGHETMFTPLLIVAPEYSNKLSYDCFRPNNQTFSCKTISNYENVVMDKY
jgi:hypothetical protein